MKLQEVPLLTITSIIKIFFYYFDNTVLIENLFDFDKAVKQPTSACKCIVQSNQNISHLPPHLFLFHFLSSTIVNNYNSKTHIVIN